MARIEGSGGVTIRLHIERLEIEGFGLQRADRRALHSAVQAELGRLLAGNGLLPELQQGGAVSRARAGVLQVRERTSPAELGTAIARSVYGGIGNRK